jgi:hypothetical protein
MKIVSNDAHQKNEKGLQRLIMEIVRMKIVSNAYHSS